MRKEKPSSESHEFPLHEAFAFSLCLTNACFLLFFFSATASFVLLLPPKGKNDYGLSTED